ncbi:glycosyltransferase family 2 protein [Yeosuana marina]|uniref:glycosyltransferase family 2 protein n=1 Tax=Yeosuana marina TaxID=1565536 RepID=UPI001423A3AD|nr:glycosyltransferase family 2 protein [Yeosuana marina]
MEPLVSIITPMFNSETYLSETVNSVLNQTYTNWELLLIDDGSTDRTLEIAQTLTSKYSNIILFKNEKNLGAALSRNKGILEAKGSYIAFLDADDLWKPEKLEKQISFMTDDRCDVCFSSYELIDEKGNSLHKTVKALPVLTYHKLLKSNYIGNLTGIYNAEVLGEITTPNLRKRQDWLLWLEAIKRSGKPAKSLLKSLAYYRVREDSMSSNKFDLLKYNYWVYKKGLGFSTVKSVYHLVQFLIEHFFMKSKQTVSTKNS